MYIFDRLLHSVNTTTHEDCPLDATSVSDLIMLSVSTNKRVRRIEKTIIAAFLAIATLHGSALFGTQTDKINNRLISLNKYYCSEDNVIVRKALTALIRAEVAFWPEEGFCDSEKDLENFLKRSK